MLSRNFILQQSRVKILTRLVQSSTCRCFASTNKNKNDWLKRIRNIGIFAHIDAGKTTTTEKMLYYAGIVRKPGNVDDGDTVTDFMQEERERGITIQSASISFPWKNSIINLIDTPGHVDFSVEVERCLRVLDGGIAILDGVAGVEAQTETVWEQANRYKLPRLLYVNKLDRVGADFDNSLKMVKERFGTDTFRLQIPLIENDQFSGIADVIHKKFIRFSSKEDESFTEETIPDSLLPAVEEAHATILEELANRDSEFEDLFLEAKEDEMNDPDRILAGIHRVMIKEALNNEISIVPVLCGSSLKNKGIKQLLDAVDTLLPSPLEVALPDIFCTIHKQLQSFSYSTCLTASKKSSVPTALSKYLKKEPLLAYVFKLQHTAQGMFIFARIYKGSIKTKSTLFNTRTRKQEKILRIMQISADHTESLTEAYEGQIVALLGLTNVKTGDTLTTSSCGIDFMLEPIHLNSPVFTVNVEAENQVELTKLEKVLQVLSLEDPSLVYKNDEESGQLLLSGMGELHLEVLQQRLKREFGLDAYYSKMRVNYKESVGEEIRIDSTYQKNVNNHDYSVKLGIEVNTAETEENKIIIEKSKYDSLYKQLKTRFNKEGTRINDDMIASLKEGIEACLSRGPLLGYPMVQTTIRLNPDLCEWDVQTPLVVLQAAIMSCLTTEIRKHKMKLLEPVMKYDAVINSDTIGNVISDLTSKRRGEIKEIASSESTVSKKSHIHAFVPLAEMIGYSSVIRILTGGENSFSLTFDRYDEVPDDIVERIRYGV